MLGMELGTGDIIAIKKEAFLPEVYVLEKGDGQYTDK